MDEITEIEYTRIHDSQVWDLNIFRGEDYIENCQVGSYVLEFYKNIIRFNKINKIIKQIEKRK